MNKKIIAVLCIVTLTLSPFSDVKSASGVISDSQGINRKNQDTSLTGIQSIIDTTVTNGMLPLFSESVFTQEESNAMLRSLGLEEMPKFYPGHNYELPPIKSETQKLLQERVDNFIRLEYMRRDFQDRLSGKTSEEILQTKPSPEYNTRSKELQNSLRNTDRQLFQIIRSNPEPAVKDITEFVIKRCDKGSLPAISHIVNNLKETVANQNSSDNDGSSSISPGGQEASFLRKTHRI